MRIFLAVIAASAWFAASASNAAAVTVPAWLFPLNLPPPGETPLFDRVKPLHVPRSRATYTEAQLNNLFSAPDWFPQSHSAMPDVVARGRAPDVYACGFCHTPGGQGRPENASLAGLPAVYIVRQLADFRSGAGGLTVACVTCHGKDLGGMALFPRLAGRSPTYLLRQLVAFKTGARAGSGGQPMRAVVENLSIGDMIAVAAYAASLAP